MNIINIYMAFGFSKLIIGLLYNYRKLVSHYEEKHLHSAVCIILYALIYAYMQ